MKITIPEQTLTLDAESYGRIKFQIVDETVAVEEPVVVTPEEPVSATETTVSEPITE